MMTWLEFWMMEATNQTRRKVIAFHLAKKLPGYSATSSRTYQLYSDVTRKLCLVCDENKPRSFLGCHCFATCSLLSHAELSRKTSRFRT